MNKQETATLSTALSNDVAIQVNIVNNFEKAIVGRRRAYL